MLKAFPKKKRKENAQKGPKNMLKGLPKRKCSKKHLKTKQIKKNEKEEDQTGHKKFHKKGNKKHTIHGHNTKKKMKKRNKN